MIIIISILVFITAVIIVYAFCKYLENKFVKELRTKLQAFEKQVLKEKEEDINKYLTEALTGKSFKECPAFTNFHTWEGFGKLFSWSKEQGWWIDFILHHPHIVGVHAFCKILEPKRFAYAIYNFLK